MQVRGYGFCNHSSWTLIFGDPEAAAASDFASENGDEKAQAGWGGVGEEEEEEEEEEDILIKLAGGGAGECGEVGSWRDLQKRKARRRCRGAVSVGAQVLSCRSLAARVPPHAAGICTVRVLRDGRLVAAMHDVFEYREEAATSVFDSTGADVAMRVRLRHIPLPVDHRNGLVLPLHFEAITRHRAHVQRFGHRLRREGKGNATDAEKESALALERVYRELLAWDPGRAASLHNYGVFLEDVCGDRAAAEWLYRYGGFHVPQQVPRPYIPNLTPSNVNPKPETRNPKPYAPHPTPYALRPTPYTPTPDP